ncbi:MAG: hypothetical protein AAGA68_19790 [Pseudomonadota bacterium]
MLYRRLFALSLCLIAAALVACAPPMPVQRLADGGLLEPNLIDTKELQQLPHVDEAVAKALVAARPVLSAGAFDAALAPMLSEEQRTELYARAFRPIDLNSATREEIMLIPGMSERMAHEFEEYRPYTSLEQFRREIGKYVDTTEVARLSQYVHIPVPLNTGTKAQLLGIPGMSERMVHEFEEYRPYTSIEQFRQEIGKYVVDQELARLESYVVLDPVQE